MTSHIRMLGAAFAAVFASLAAFAEATVTGSNPIPEGETLVFDVPSGETYTCSDALSGAGGVKKTGTGKLILSGANTYVGGFELAAGSVEIQSATAFGSGKVTSSSTTNPQIYFNAPDATITNDFDFTSAAGGGSWSAPAFMAQANAVLTGDFSWTRETYGGAAANVALTFEGTVGTTGKSFVSIESAGSTVHFKGSVQASTFYTGFRFNHTGTAYLHSSANACNEYYKAAGLTVCEDENVLGGGALLMYPSSGGSSCGTLDLNGLDQTVTMISYYWKATNLPTAESTTGIITSSSGSPTFTVAGTGKAGTSVSYYQFDGAVNVVVDANSSYKQQFVKRISGTTGVLWAKGGTMEVTDGATFAAASEVKVDAGATFLLNSEFSGALAGATNVVVDGVFTCGSAVPNPFGAEATVRLGAGAELTLPAEATVTIRDLVVNGEKMSGDFSAGDLRVPQLKAGRIVATGSASSDTWTGKGATASIADGANWQGGEKPDFGGGLTATFSAADAERAEAVVDADVRFAGLVFDTADGFTFRPDSTAHEFAVGKDGITVASGSSGDYRFLAPVEFSAPQGWSTVAGTTLSLLGGTSAQGTVDKTGAGRLVVAGENVWDDRVTVVGGNVLLTGATITTSSGPDGIAITGKDAVSWDADKALYLKLATEVGAPAAATLTISNAVVEKTVMVRFPSSSSTHYFFASAGSTNEFRGFFRTCDASNQRLSAGIGSVTRFLGGGYCPWAFGLVGQGTVLIGGKPFSTARNLSTSRGRLIFEVGGNSFYGLSLEGDGGWIDMKVDDVAGKAGCPLSLIGSLSQTAERKKQGAQLDIFATTQHFSQITGSNAGRDEGRNVDDSFITGTAGSLVVVTNKSAAAASTLNRVTFRGAVSYCHDSASGLMITNAASTSTGSLTVRNGTVTFAENASWTTASAVALEGGTLVLKSGANDHRTFGKKTPLSISGDAILSVQGVGTQVFGGLQVNGVDVPPGTYTYATAPAILKERLDPAADGRIRICGGGIVLLVR